MQMGEESSRCVLVCVTVQKECARLIALGRERAEKEQLPLRVLHVAQSPDELLGSPDSAQAMNALYSLSHEAGAEMTILYQRDVHPAIIGFAREHGARVIVVGNDARGERKMAQAVTRALPEAAVVCQ